MTASGMILATAGFAFSRASSPADTVAATALTSRYPITCAAWTCDSSRTRPLWLAAIAADRAASCGRALERMVGSFFRKTITCWVAFADNVAA